MAKTKTEEDWFLRGGERPAQEDAPSKPDSPHECDACDECDGHHHCDECPHLTDGEDDDDDEVLQDWIVTMYRTRSVQQIAKVRVKAHSVGEAMDLVEDRAEDEAGSWSWNDVGCTEEFDGIEAVEAEVAG